MATVTQDAPHHDGPIEVPAVNVGPVRRVALMAAGIGFGLWALLGAVNWATPSSHDHTAAFQDFFFTYLCGWVFWAFLPFGAMALLMIGYLTDASWGVVLRRIFQAATRTLPLTAVLFLPIAASLFVADGKAAPYWWADKTWAGDKNAVAAAKETRPEAVEENQHKIHDYLNPGFFLLRAVVYFAVLGGLIYLLNKWSRPAEETDDPAAKARLGMISGPGLIVWALLLTFGITDWVMSVEPTWASSMFPVVYGMEQFMVTFALSIFLFYTLNPRGGAALAIVKEKFRIDMGSLLLAFTMVWAYATFCQYMLIWAGNLPEEVAYFRKRGDHGWQYLAYLLMGFHWLLPFVILLFREVKTDPVRMRAVCLLLLAIGAGDVIWWLLPAVPREHGWLHVPMAVGAILGVGGVWGLLFARELDKRAILPSNSETRFLATWGHH